MQELSDVETKTILKEDGSHMKSYFYNLRTDAVQIVPTALALHYQRVGIGYVLGTFRRREHNVGVATHAVA